MKEIWLSPSDLSYFWSDSKIGFYDKYVLGIQRPRQPFPSVFNSIDLAMKSDFDNKSCSKIVAEAPDGILRHKELFVKSKMIDLKDFRVGFSGKMDCLMDHGDGFHSVIDYKTTKYSEKLIDIYFLQLMAYAYCLENPLNGDPKHIRGLGLLVFDPNKFSHKSEKGSLGGKMHWVDIPFDKAKFKHWLTKELNPLLHSKRELIEVSKNDQMWENYVANYDVSEQVE